MNVDRLRTITLGLLIDPDPTRGCKSQDSRKPLISCAEYYMHPSFMYDNHDFVLGAVSFSRMIIMRRWLAPRLGVVSVPVTLTHDGKLVKVRDGMYWQWLVKLAMIPNSTDLISPTKRESRPQLDGTGSIPSVILFFPKFLPTIDI